MRLNDFIETEGMTVEERLGALIASCNFNTRNLQAVMDNIAEKVSGNSADIRELSDLIDTHQDTIDALLDNIAKVDKKKAGKFGFTVVVIAGIAYVIKNERDKHKMRRVIIQLDKDARGCEQFHYDPQENEGEAKDPER